MRFVGTFRQAPRQGPGAVFANDAKNRPPVGGLLLSRCGEDQKRTFKPRFRLSRSVTSSLMRPE
jgi:hypothetical protein